MPEKTPTSILSEFCAQQKVGSEYNAVSEESYPSVPLFTYSVTAFGHTAKGSGRSKSEGKHAASQALIDILSQLGIFKDKMNSSSSSPKPNVPNIQNNDAVGALIKLCQQRNLPEPEYEVVSITGEAHSRQFTMRCIAGEYEAREVGSTKKDVKQLVALYVLNLIENDPMRSMFSDSSDCSMLSSCDTIPSLLTLQEPEPPLNLSAFPNQDAVCALTTLCLQRYWTAIPSYECVSITGEDHQKVFAYECKLGEFQCFGTAKSKKGAKQTSAQEMYTLIQQKIHEYETGIDTSSLGSLENVPWAIPIEEIPTVEDVLAEYRRLKKQYIPPARESLRYRKNFFLKLPNENKKKAKQLLIRTHSGFINSRHIVDEVLKALNLDYKVETRSGQCVFTLTDCEYDCVLIARPAELFDKVIDYLKTMLNVQNAAEGNNDF